MGAPSSLYLKILNADYIEELFQKYLTDPEAVDDSWRYFFDGLELGTLGGGIGSGQVHGSPTPSGVDLVSEAKVADLINAYRERGRILARINPLQSPPATHPLLDLQNFGLTQADFSRTFSAGNLLGLGQAPLSQILDFLKSTYCGSVGVEFTHIEDPIAHEWLKVKIESERKKETITVEEKKWIHRRLAESNSTRSQ
jgi:2-oxoglutarate dehydrogenase E1 component